MATKKNATKEEKAEPTTTQLSYSGEVKITVKRGKSTLKTIRKHNAGTECLFKAILNFLIGYPNVGNAPNFIDALGKSTSESGPGESVLVYKSNISSKTLQFTTDSKFKAVFTGYISSKQLKQSTTESNEEGIYYLALVDNNNNRLADIDVTTNGKPLPIAQGTSIIVEWYMGVDNAPTATTRDPTDSTGETTK